MILVEGSVGNPNLIFPRHATLRRRVMLPQPVQKAKVLLRGFDIANTGTDRNVQNMKVRLELGYGDGANEVEVIASVELEDQSPTGEVISLEVMFTIIGE